MLIEEILQMSTDSTNVDWRDPPHGIEIVLMLTEEILHMVYR